MNVCVLSDELESLGLVGDALMFFFHVKLSSLESSKHARSNRSTRIAL